MKTNRVIKVLNNVFGGKSVRTWAVVAGVLLGSLLTSCSDDDDVSPNRKVKVVELSSDTLSASFSYLDATYEAVLLQLDDVKVGVNTVYAYLLQESTDGLLAIDRPEDYSIGVYPYMPGMGHSSPNNADFVWDAETNAYVGTLNFTMSGLWQVFLTIRKGEEVVADEVIWTFQLGSSSMSM